MRILTTFLVLLFFMSAGHGQVRVKIAKLQYDGGGDWYANKTALPNLVSFCNETLNMNLDPEDDVVHVNSPELFLYPYVYMTGHGNVVFSDQDAENLRTYLEAGGFLHIDDNYGLDQFVRMEMKKVFPELDFIVIALRSSYLSPTFRFSRRTSKDS